MLGGGGSSRGRRVFSKDNNNNVHSKRFNKLEKKSHFIDDDFDISLQASTHRSFVANLSFMDTDQDPDPSTSPFKKSPWSSHVNPEPPPSTAADGNSNSFLPNILMGSLVREEGHIYSLAASGDLLYTGSDSKNIRVWKNHKEFSGFKSNSGLVKSIVIGGDKIFTGHQDGKVRVWKVSGKDPSIHKRVGTLPTLSDYIKCSIKPSNYVEGRGRKNLWIKHFDAISSLSLSEDNAFLYSASWDKTFKVWRVSDFKCLESIQAHDDAVNTLVSSIDGLVFTGSADGRVKVWRRELQGKGTKHFFSQTLVKQECAVTALAVNDDATFVYCGSSDGVVNFWEREKSLSHSGALRGHKLAILCLATAGHLLLSGSADMGICVWQRTGAEHACLSVLTGHAGPVKCLAIERDRDAGEGDRRWIVYSGSLDKSVKMWRVSEQPSVVAQSPPCYSPKTSPTAGLLVNAPSFVIREQ